MSIMNKTRSKPNLAWTERCRSQEEKDFFCKSLLKQRSTFGGSNKVVGKPVSDDGYSFAFKERNWQRYEEHGTLVPRPRIVRNLGALQKSPGPGAYDDRDELRSKIETAPAYSMGIRKTPKWFGEVDVPGPGTYKMRDHVEPFLEKQPGLPRPKSAQAGVPQFVSPGPGHYETPSDLLYKFEADPETRLPPRTSSSPRKTLDAQTLVVKERYNSVDTLGPLMYDTMHDPRELHKAVTVGEKRERVVGLPPTVPDMPPGPGTYDADDLVYFGRSNCQSTPLSKELHKGGNIKALILQRNGQTASEWRIKQKINAQYKSPYSCPKKKPATTRFGSSHRR